jgi:hypothetical protein
MPGRRSPARAWARKDRARTRRRLRPRRRVRQPVDRRLTPGSSRLPHRMLPAAAAAARCGGRGDRSRSSGGVGHAEPMEGFEASSDHRRPRTLGSAPARRPDPHEDPRQAPQRRRPRRAHDRNHGQHPSSSPSSAATRASSASRSTRPARTSASPPLTTGGSVVDTRGANRAVEGPRARAAGTNRLGGAPESAPENRECPEKPVVDGSETFELRSGDRRSSRRNPSV